MKIKLSNNFTDLGVTFFKGKIYNAKAAVNLKSFIRLGKNNLTVKKIFVEKGAGKSRKTALIELKNNKFDIIDCSEDEINNMILKYNESKVKVKRVKQLVPLGYTVREGFTIAAEPEIIKYNLPKCTMGKFHKIGGVCNAPTKFIKEIKRPGKKTIRIPRCAKCVATPINS